MIAFLNRAGVDEADGDACMVVLVFVVLQVPDDHADLCNHYDVYVTRSDLG